jgi:hypothetical protein
MMFCHRQKIKTVKFNTYHTLFPQDRHTILNAIYTAGNLAEIIATNSLLLCAERAVIRSRQLKVTAAKVTQIENTAQLIYATILGKKTTKKAKENSRCCSMFSR